MTLVTIFSAVISILLVLLTPLILKLVKKHADEKTLGIVFSVAKGVVFALEEQIKGLKMGPKRYAQAVEDIKAILELYNIDADNILIDKAIHAAVYLINANRMVDTDEEETGETENVPKPQPMEE